MKDISDQQKLRAEAVIWDMIGATKFWEQRDPAIRIPYAILSLAAGLEHQSSQAEPYVLGLVIEDGPFEETVRFVPLLAYLELKMRSVRSRQDCFELMLFKRKESAIDAFVRGEVHFLKLGGSGYLRVQQLHPTVKLLVAQYPPKQGVIVVRDDSNLYRLEDLINRSVAFGGAYSTLSIWGCFELAKAGVSGSSLKYYEALDLASGFSPETAINASLSVQAFEAVSTNGFDAAVASAKPFRETAAQSGLRKLAEFTSDPVVWMARGDLPAELISGLRRSLVDLKEPTILLKVTPNLRRFVEVSDASFDELRKATTTAVHQFPQLYETDE